MKRINHKNNIRSHLFNKEVGVGMNPNQRYMRSYFNKDSSISNFQIDNIKEKYGYEEKNTQSIQVRDNMDKLKKKYFLLEQKARQLNQRKQPLLIINNPKPNEIQNFRLTLDKNKMAESAPVSYRNLLLEKQGGLFYKRDMVSNYYPNTRNHFISTYLHDRPIAIGQSEVKKLATSIYLSQDNEMNSRFIKRDEAKISSAFPISKRIILLQNLKGNIRQVLHRNKSVDESILNQENKSRSYSMSKLDPEINDVLNEIKTPQNNNLKKFSIHRKGKSDVKYFNISKTPKLLIRRRHKINAPSYSTIL